MRTAFITFSASGARIGERLYNTFERLTMYVHSGAEIQSNRHCRFDSVVSLVANILNRYEGIIFCGPCGVAVRAIAPYIRHKSQDPAVVVLDVGARYAVSLLGGHEAGANKLAMSISNAIGAEPIISTTTEAAKTLIVGVGCRKGVPAKTILSAVRLALDRIKAAVSQVRVMASAELKSRESGLLEAAGDLGLPLRFISSDELSACRRRFEKSAFVEQKTGLPAVAEPAALLAGRRTQLILPKMKHQGVTVAIAKECFM